MDSPSLLDTVDRLLSEIGPLDETIGQVARKGDDVWLVLVDDDVVVEIILDEEAGLLRLCTEIGVPAKKDLARIYEILLIFNSTAQRTGDVVMALSGPGGSILQMVALRLDGLTPQTLVTPVVNLADAALTWRAFVVQGTSQDEAPVAFDPTELMIRI